MDMPPMSRPGSPVESRSRDAFDQTIVTKVVGALIATRGYDVVIDELVSEVYHLGEISIADPSNLAKHRAFDVWAKAVRNAIQEHAGARCFAIRITASDRLVASQMGITLD